MVSGMIGKNIVMFKLKSKASLACWEPGLGGKENVSGVCRDPTARKYWEDLEELECSLCGYRVQSRKEAMLGTCGPSLQMIQKL